MVKLTPSNSPLLFQKKVDINRNMLIIAEGLTDYQLNRIAYYDSAEVVESLYGLSSLSKAFSKAKTMGVKYIFLANVKRKTDYIELADIIKQYDFTYVVPLGLHFSDSFYNDELNRDVTYSEYLLETIGDSTRSLLVMTDYHASLYEDIDHFIMDMSSKIYKFKNVAKKALRNGRNLCVVANNLVNSYNSNLELACALCTCSYDKYPEYDFGEAIFDIDETDVTIQEFTYFRNNENIYTSIENLKNFRNELDAAKIVVIDMVIKFIERQLDFSEFDGKFYSDYVKLEVYKRLSEFLQGIVGTTIRNYAINSVDFVVTEPGAGVIVNSFSVLPINSAESLDLVMEV
jgi:hypothetical protein